MRADGQGQHFSGLISWLPTLRALPLANVGVCTPESSLRGAEGAGVHVVDFAVLVSCLLCLGAHFTPGDALKSGLGAPPLLVADDGKHLGEEFHSPTLKGLPSTGRGACRSGRR